MELRQLNANLQSAKELLTVSFQRYFSSHLVDRILNSSKPVCCSIGDVASLGEMIELCSIVAGGEQQLQAKPFLVSSVEPVSPLVQGKDAVEKSLLCAEKNIPNVVYSMPMCGATAPATFAGNLAIANAEIQNVP